MAYVNSGGVPYRVQPAPRESRKSPGTHSMHPHAQGLKRGTCRQCKERVDLVIKEGTNQLVTIQHRTMFVKEGTQDFCAGSGLTPQAERR